MNETFNDIRGFIDYLEKKNDLVRVKREVDPDLEVNAILDRLARTHGPAVLFEKVKGSDIPLLGNAFGDMGKLSSAFGCDDFAKMIDDKIDELSGAIPEEGKGDAFVKKALSFKGIIDGVGKIPDIVRMVKTFKNNLSPLRPVEIKRSKAPCKEVILTGDDVDLTKFPLIKLWPQDGGRYITLPLVITRDPETQDLNVGIYRMMMLDKKRLCMHWLPQKHGNQHHAKAVKMGKDLPVAVVVGADPAIEVAGVFPLMGGANEYMAAGVLKGKPIEVTRAEDSDLWVPAGAEIVFEGVVKHDEIADEGPFGEFHGYYSPVKQTHVFHINKITMRKNPIWHAATTGMPPTEIHTFSKASERLAAAMLKKLYPGVVDLNLTRESGTLYTHIVSFNKTRPYEAQELMHFIWAMSPQSPFITTIIVVDGDIDVQDLSKVFWAISLNFRPEHDLTITPVGLADMERPCTYPRGVGARMGIDATTKTPEEGHIRKMPDLVTMDPNVTALIERQWKEYGFK